MNGNGHRWSKFWWRDHQGDAALRMCSLAARGLWMELLCLAHEASPVGHVLVNGTAPTPQQIAAIVGVSSGKIPKLLAELEKAGVFSRTDDGTIYSRRMVKDAAASELGREHFYKRYQGHNPDDPIRGATRDPTSKPNGGATREPYTDAFGHPSRDPSSRSLEAEEEAEERPPVGPHEVGTSTPQAGTPPARRADGTNPRAVGTNPRQTGENPRANGTNGRAAGTNPRSRSAGWDECARQRREHWETIEGSAEHVVDLAARRLANG